MKRIYFLLVFFFLGLNRLGAQADDEIIHDSGIFATLEYSPNNELLIIPQLWFYSNDIYVEARYNYEDKQTLSYYIGKSFSIDNDVEFEIIPMFGASFGNTFGVSPAFNMTLEYKRFSTYTECQYTYNFRDKRNSFYFDRTNFSTEINKYFDLGGAIQIYRPNEGEPFFKIGPSVSFNFTSFKLELIAFNFWDKKLTYAFAIEFNFE
jgi:hypothetical protein